MLIYFNTDRLQIFREIPFIKPRNYTSTTDKQLKTMINERKTYLVLFEFLQLVQCLEDCWHDSYCHGMT